MILNAKLKMADTGYDLEYDKNYTVSLEVNEDLLDNGIPCDFSGWNEEARLKNNFKHKLFKFFSRMRSANIFSLIGVLDGKKFDLGEVWTNAGKDSFVLSLSKQFPNEKVSGRLFVYLNDVPGFYGNNEGSYKITGNEDCSS